MASPSPSIQAFFSVQSSSSRSSSPTKSAQPTNSDPVTFNDVPSSPLSSWKPEREYSEVDISSLIPGPQCVTITGRIANFYDQATPSKMPRAAKGCLRLIVKDDSGAITVRLWYAATAPPLRLGNLVALWTAHISSGGTNDLTSPAAPLLVSMFPERDRSCHFVVLEEGNGAYLCKTPLGFQQDKPLQGLMTLKSFVDGGSEIEGSSVLVVVKSVGPKRTVTNRNNTSSTLLTLTIVDNTASACLTLWGSSVASASAWNPSSTILLLTDPQCKVDRRADLSIGRNTIVDVDPAIVDADWLREFAERMKVRDHVNPAFPEGEFDVEEALTAVVRPLFTLGELDALIRAAPNETLNAFLSIVILELNLSTLHMRNMLLCTECCGLPHFSNETTTLCKHCNTHLHLRINPRALGTVIDESGALASGKLILSDEAWKQLLGRNVDKLVEMGTDGLRGLERRVKGVRVSLLAGWVGRKAKGHGSTAGGSEDQGAFKREEGEGVIGRLCVLRVMM